MGTARHYYSALVRRAFSGRFWLAQKITGALFLFSPLLMLLPFPEKWERYWITWGPVVFFGALFSTTVCVGFLTAPYFLHREEVARREALEQRLNTPAHPGIEGISLSAEDAAWEMLTRALPLKEHFETAIDSDRARIWHCLVWLLNLAQKNEITLYGRESGSRLYRAIDVNQEGYSFSVSEVRNQIYRVNEAYEFTAIFEGKGSEDYVWDDDIRVRLEELEAVIAGFNSGKLDDWVDHSQPPDALDME
jgi:hypothetical protein